MENRKVILYIATSLDGYISRTDGAVDWLFTDQDYGYAEFYNSIDTIIMGRASYDQVLTFGPYQYHEKHTYVISSTVGVENENVEFYNDHAVALVEKLKKKEGKDIWLFGGAKTVRPFMELNLVDQYVFSIHPIILGDGIQLFGQNAEIPLVLKDVKTFDSGLVQLIYHKKV